jgi:hypothetical protein
MGYSKVQPTLNIYEQIEVCVVELNYYCWKDLASLSKMKISLKQIFYLGRIP